MAVINSPLESQFGFKAPGFSVDALGNITATSLIQTGASADVGVTDYEVVDHRSLSLVACYPVDRTWLARVCL